MCEKFSLKLKNIYVPNIVFNPINDDITDTVVDGNFGINISVGYLESDESYLNDSTVNLKIELEGFVREYVFNLTILSEVLVSNNDITYEKLTTEYSHELAQPSLDKASLVIGSLYEHATGFPFLVDIHSLYLNEDSEHKK